jgi:hypothetical protein
MRSIAIHRHVATALALTACGLAGAQTFTPPPDGNNNLLDLSGATSTDGVIIAAMIGGDASAICDGTLGNPDVYTTEAQLTFGVLTNNFMIVCKPKSTIGLSVSGGVYAVRKFSGGSGSGISNVASGTAVASDVTNDRQWTTSAGCTSAGVQAAIGGGPAWNLFINCPTDAAAQVTKGGISDEEPALLGASTTVLGELTTSAGIAVDFAPVISTALQSALQTAENLAVSGTDDGPNMPNLSSTEVAGMLKGAITTTNNFLFQNPATNTGAAPAFPAGTLFVCRRGSSSGTETGFAIHYLSQGCGTAGVGSPNLTFVGATNAGCTASGCGWNSTTFGTDRVFAGTGSADVIACMDFHSKAGQYAIGVLTTEYAPNDAAGAQYRHVKVDGVQPSLENQATGAWSFFTEDAFNVPNSTAPNFANVTADQAKLTTAIQTAFKAAANLSVALISQGSGGVAWWGGALAIPATAGATFTPQGTNSLHSAVSSTPVGSATHSLTYGGALNNCNPAWSGGRSMVPIDSTTY